MGATIADEGKLKVVRMSGLLHKAEMDAIQWGEVKRIGPAIAGMKVNVLVIAENFEGWNRKDTWGDVTFVAKYGDRIHKMAIVADPKWEDRFLMFTGAGFRETQIKYFPPEEEAEAREWLEE